MIKIAYLIQSWHLGGIETAIYNITKYLSEQYHDLKFYFIASDNSEIHPRYNRIGTCVYHGQNWRKMSAFLRENDIDIVQYGNLTQYKNVALNAGTKVIIERIAGPRSVNTDHSGISHMICSSNGIAKIVRKTYDGSLSIIKNGVMIPGNIGKDRLGFLNRDFLVVYPAARMGDGQAYDHLIEAVKIAHNRNNNIKLILMGDRPNQKGYPNIKPKLQKLAKPLGNNCVFTGFVSDPLPIINGSDLCVVPAKSHGISNALVESASLGKPLIATDVGQTNEICVHNKNGYLVKIGDIKMLAEYILYLSNNPKKCKEFGLNGINITKVQHDICIQAEKYRNLYLSFPQFVDRIINI